MYGKHVQLRAGSSLICSANVNFHTCVACLGGSLGRAHCRGWTAVLSAFVGETGSVASILLEILEPVLFGQRSAVVCSCDICALM